MKITSPKSKGFTLMETVIAIGVLAVLLSGFIAVFAPATQGIRRSISIQQADRLATTLEKELVTYRENQEDDTDIDSAFIDSAFSKAFTWIEDSNTPEKALFIYQYRGDPTSLRSDNTPDTVPDAIGQPGEDYIVQSIARRLDDEAFSDDLAALEGQIFYVKITQLVSDGTGLIEGAPGTILADPSDSSSADATSSDEYEDAVIAFTADFYSVPTIAASYIQGDGFTNLFNRDEDSENPVNPVFSRNMAIRR